MGRSAPFVWLLLAGSWVASGCSGGGGSGGTSGSGGTNAMAGVAGTGGGAGIGGASASGGGAGRGGTAGAAGVAEMGGSAGVTGMAGTSDSGGAGGDAGGAGAGGASASAGATASGGTGGDGSDAGRGGSGGGGGASGNGGAGGAGGAGGMGGVAGAGVGGDACGSPSGGAAGAPSGLAHFSFFVTSLGAMRTLSGSQDGFGGDLRFGEVGPGAGLRGADKICATIAETSMPGSGAKGWRAFLSATTDGCGSGVVNAIDRIGNGPWYDRLGRLVAQDKAALVNERPQGADALIVNDLPNEDGIPNHTDGQPGCVRDQCPDNHDVLTGSTTSGTLWSVSNPFANTCNDWTSAVGTTGRPTLGHSWPASSGMSWMQSHNAQGCAPGVHLNPGTLPTVGMTVGYGGGYGGIYCFALTP